MFYRLIDNLGSYIFCKKDFLKFYSRFKISFLFIISLLMFLISNLMNYIDIFKSNPSTADMILKPLIFTFAYFVIYFFYLLYYSYSDLILIRRKDKKVSVNMPLRNNYLTIFNRSIFVLIMSLFSMIYVKILFALLFLLLLYLNKRSIYKGFYSKSSSWVFIIPAFIEILLNLLF